MVVVHRVVLHQRLGRTFSGNEQLAFGLGETWYVFFAKGISLTQRSNGMDSNDAAKKYSGVGNDL